MPGFESLGREEYARNAGRIAEVSRFNQELAAITQTKSTAALIADLNAIGVPVSRVNDLPNVCADPLLADNLLRARDTRSGTEIAVPPPPVISEFLQRQGLTLAFPPRLGQHNEAIFGALGCDTDDLRTKGVI